jgi:hypothetical protein
MLRTVATLGFLAVLASGGAAHADSARARAAQDLGCSAGKVKVQDWGGKVEARGCGRNAEYERKDGQLQLTMLELEPTPEMRRQAMSDLECAGDELILNRLFEMGVGEVMHASGCGREATYDVKGGKLELSRLARRASGEILQKVADDLGCPASTEVNVVRDGKGVVTVVARSCKDGTFQRYALEPFKRLTEQVEATTVELVKLAAKDLGCDPNKLVVSTESREMTPGKEVQSEKVTVDGCARRAVYVRKPTGWTLSSGPVEIQTAKQPPKRETP